MTLFESRHEYLDDYWINKEAIDSWLFRPVESFCSGDLYL